MLPLAYGNDVNIVTLSVVFLLMLSASVISMVHLRHATKPPQLFRPDTNVQMLLDLMANYTSEGIPRLPADYKPVCRPFINNDINSNITIITFCNYNYNSVRA